MGYRRVPLGPGAFARACERLEQLRPDLSQTSGRRSPQRNTSVGGSPVSKHLASPRDEPYRAARDYVADSMPWSDPNGRVRIAELELQAKILGLFAQVHGAAGAQHIHIQNRPRADFDYTADGWTE